MRTIQTEVLVVGGGATGTGVARDCAMRGFSCVLVERRDLSDGTTGRYHGLLHSGGRYVVKDPRAATECIEENKILRQIMPHCLEDTGGFFVLTPSDDPNYVAQFLDGCQETGVPVEEIPVDVMFREEPLLNPKISRCFRVPDASADSFLATELNAKSARGYGATVLNYHELTSLIVVGNRIVGGVCHDLLGGEQVTIHADIVVSAAGAWAGKIASLADIDVQLLPGKGTMLAMNHRMVNTVLNRCKMPSDGDIVVPIHTVAVLGTTDELVRDPDHFGIESWEVDLMLNEAEEMIPGVSQMRVLRAWAGVRPLFQEKAASDSREISRAYALLDHASRDGFEGFVTITGGKWTTYRQMAQATADLVCEKLDTNRACKTHLEELPGAEAGYHYLGARLHQVEQRRSFGDLLCECELATEEDVRSAIIDGEAKSLDDIRRDVRLGMGPCQGGFCTVRAVAMLHRLREKPITSSNVAIHDFLQERWKGLRPVLWGLQLRQARLDQLIYASVLNAEHLPGDKSSALGPMPYEEES
jgi:glycerol-3-phosphate dehydrogenase